LLLLTWFQLPASVWVHLAPAIVAGAFFVACISSLKPEKGRVNVQALAGRS
jgi:uncharacterized protein (DUF983 family)